MQRFRLLAAALFAIAAVAYAVLSVISSFDRVIHIATTVVFALVAVMWTHTYLKEGSRPSD